MNIKEHTQDATINLALDTIRIEKQALVFADSKRSAEKAAEDIARKLRTKSAELDELALKILKALPAPTKQCKRLAICVKRGIAFHHAGLVAKQRELIEDAFRGGIVKVICATPTLAFGVDTPAFRVIIKSLKRYSGAWGMDWIPTLEYHQMCGRAGRPKFHDDYGEAVAIARTDGEQDEIFTRYVTGKPEDITSKLAVEPVLRMYVLSLVASGFVRTKKQLIDFFEKTFWAHHYRDMAKLSAIIDKILGLLELWGFLSAQKDDFVSAAELGHKTGLTATLLGRRVAELYIDPYTAHHLIEGMGKNDKSGTFALLQLISHTLEMRPLLRTRVKEQEDVQKALLENYESLLEMEPNIYDHNYDEFFDSVKTAMFFNSWIDEANEEWLLEKYSIRPGEIRAKTKLAEWLLYAMGEIAPLLKMQSKVNEIRKLRIRVQKGVREELLTLLRLDGVGRVRARKLYNAKLKDVGELKKADIGVIAQLIGMKTALRVKKQLGQEVKEVPLGKRKGQVSLGKF